jgi:Cu/Ag efflux protein CusF
MKRIAFLAVALFGTGALAQTPPVKVRGTIVSLDGDTLTVKSKDGTEKKIELAKDAQIAVAQKTSLSEIKPGTYVGSTAVKGPDGKLVAREVHTIPPQAPSGHMPWDTESGATMTNANLTGVAKATGGDEITLQYKDGEQKIVVPKGTPVLTFTPADRAALKKGETIFTMAREQDGKLTTQRVQVSKDGVKPAQ